MNNIFAAIAIVLSRASTLNHVLRQSMVLPLPKATWRTVDKELILLEFVRNTPVRMITFYGTIDLFDPSMLPLDVSGANFLDWNDFGPLIPVSDQLSLFIWKYYGDPIQMAHHPVSALVIPATDDDVALFHDALLDNFVEGYINAQPDDIRRKVQAANETGPDELKLALKTLYGLKDDDCNAMGLYRHCWTYYNVY